MESDISIQLFALELKKSVEYLIQQFKNLGISKVEYDYVTEEEQKILRKYIRDNNISSVHKFSFRRKTHSIVNVLSVGGKNKQVQVEVRKKQIYTVDNSIKKCDMDLSVIDSDEKNNVLTQKIVSSSIDHKLIDLSLKKDNNSCSISNNVYSTLTPCDEPIIDNRSSPNVDILNPVKNCDNTLNVKKRCKINDKQQKNISKKHQLNKLKDMYSDWNTQLSTYYSKNDNSSDSMILDNSSVLEKNSFTVDYQSKNDTRFHSQIRTKSKIVGKSFKQRKNNYFSTNFDLVHESNKSDKLSSLYRFNKNKKKKNNSILIQNFNKPTRSVSKNIIIREKISILELSNKMSIKGSDLIKAMMQLGLVVTINQVIDQETAQLVVEEMGHNAILRRDNELEELVMNDNNIKSLSINNKNDPIIYKNRAPVVTVVGHVDHGKTSLLDYIRSTKTVFSEVGGITQSIGVYQITTRKNRVVTFLDTPGHAAFSSMRMRGVQLTDIVILVIAADDGVMPQTVESIQHIQSMHVPVIVAINKIDKSDINISHVKRDLNRYGLIPEDWGGDTQCVNVSAKSGIGIDDLLDSIILKSDMLDLKTAHNNGIAKAIVIESFIDIGKGSVIVVLIKEGELRCGDVILCGTEYGRVRAIYNEYNQDIDVAWPSMPVKILGLSGIPNSGDIMIVVRDEKKARDVAFYRKNKSRKVQLDRRQEDLGIGKNFFNFDKKDINFFDSNLVELNFLIKSDTKGSMEAIYQSLMKFSTDKIVIRIISMSVGNITETDVVLASTSNATILGFNIKPDFSARRIIELSNLNVRFYSIIYELLHDVEKIINNSVSINSPQFSFVGSAEVRNIFNSIKSGTIAGCMVTHGIIKVKRKIIIFRDNIEVYKGEVISLRHFKNDVNEVTSGMECGIGIKDYHNIQRGDVIKVLDFTKISI